VTDEELKSIVATAKINNERARSRKAASYLAAFVSGLMATSMVNEVFSAAAANNTHNALDTLAIDRAIFQRASCKLGK
jgi:hypothetical protein